MSALISGESQKQFEEVAVCGAGPGAGAGAGAGAVVDVECEVEDIRAPIREDEFERLPDYVIDLIHQAAQGNLTACSEEDLHNQCDSYFANCVTTKVVEVREVTTEQKDECRGDAHSVSDGEISSSQ
jgi:hypothetical protein